MIIPQPREALIVLDRGPAARPDAIPCGSFQSYRCRPDHLKQLFSIRKTGFHAVAAEFMPMVQLLDRSCAGDFADIVDLKTRACGREGAAPSAGTINAMRDLFLEIPNRRLQSLYCAYFTESPLDPSKPHDEKIAALDNVKERARNIVADYDWRWLADWLRLDLVDETAQSCLARLSNFAFAVRRVNLRFTYHCNISCRHCYNSSGPHVKAQRIKLDAMRAIVAQMPDAGIPALNITGGEPFLYLGDVLELVAAGRAAGLREISVYTNGFWAETPEKAEYILGRLAAAGFMQGPGDHLQVSAGVYHQEFIALDRIFVLAKAYRRMFGRRLRLNFELASGSRGNADEGDVRKRVMDAGIAKCVSLSFRRVDNIGRGRDLPDAALQPIDVPCDSIDQIVFDPDGAARPCCGYNNENHGVKIGELDRHPLRVLIKRMQNDPVLQFLARNPMSAIFEHVDVKRNEAGYSGQCSLCQHALGGLADKESLQARLFGRQEFYPFWFTQPPLSDLQ